MSDTVTLVTLADLNRILPSHRDVPLSGIGTFRLHRLGLNAMFRLQSTLASIDLDSTAKDANGEPVNPDAFLEPIIPIIAESMGGEWNTKEGIEGLSRLNVTYKTELLKQLTNLHRMNGDDHTEDIEAAKND